MIKSPNPPKGSFSKKFSDKYDRYYKEALDKSKEKYSDLTKREFDKVFSLKRKDFSVEDIIKEFKKVFGKKISRMQINRILAERAKAAQIAWVRIKHSYEKSTKSGKWVLKKSK